VWSSRLPLLTLRATVPAGIGSPPYPGSSDPDPGVFRSRPPCSAAAQRHTGADMADQVTTGRFVGRTNELARLHQLLARAGGGEALVGGSGGGGGGGGE